MKTAAARLAYCEKTLAGALSPERRSAVEAKATEYRQSLAGHCARCGRGISGAGPFGPVCTHKAAA